QRLALAVYVGARDGVLEQGICLITQAHGIHRRQRKLSRGSALGQQRRDRPHSAPRSCSSRCAPCNAPRQFCRYIRYHLRAVLPKLVHLSAGLPSQSHSPVPSTLTLARFQRSEPSVDKAEIYHIWSAAVQKKR